MVSLDQFKAGFLTECDELLVEMEGLLVELTPETANKETLNAIFRCAHSIKGGSGAFGLDYITHFTHVLEALLDSMREGKVPVSRGAVDALLKSVDVVMQMVAAAKAGALPPADLGAELKITLQVLASDEAGSVAAPVNNAPQQAASVNAPADWQINFAAHETMFASGNDPLLVLRELCSLGQAKVTAFIHRVPPLEQLDPAQCFMGWSISLTTDKPESTIREVFEFVEGQCDLTISRTEAASESASSVIEQQKKPLIVEKAREAEVPFNRRSSDASAATTIRVDIEKVDKLVNMVGELVITEAMIKAQVRDLPPEKFEALLRGVDELSQHTRELQEAVMSVRMQPVKSIFSRMPRIVRDLSAQLSKDIVLLTEGENTEVDKTVIEQLGDPLTHMIRNSVDHGIEKPEKRLAAGKAAQGTIVLSATHQGGRIVIEIRDDGAGINRERVLAKAREKGLVPEDVTPSNEEIDNIIFMAGFSTAEIVTNVSGRGVGMDVVRRNIEALEGTVSVKTNPGKGSVFTVSLPLTLAILDGMIVRVGAENYIIPITSIIETLRPKKDEVRHVEGTSDVINVRGEFIPIVYLHQIFTIKNAERDPSKALVVLVEAGRDKLGVLVDELIGQQQVVIKSLEANSDPIRGISGATILGDGRVSLILEISQLKELGQMLYSPQRKANAA
ncbi:MAG: chemotaxis protein CheA [Rickettsiales bacterium]|nr:chemotaxis protein CheA [Rickettsiales bacterium]